MDQHVMEKSEEDLKKVKTTCPICSSPTDFWTTVEQSAFQMHRVTEPAYNNKHFHLFRCRRCGHGHHYPGVEDQETLINFYAQDYADDYIPNENNERFLQRKEQYKQDIACAIPYLSVDQISVLDFGCSVGEYLNAMPSSWEKHGFEVNSHEIDYLRKNQQHIRVYDDLAKVPEKQFDLITLRGVIEHLFDFEAVFALINKSIKPGGHVFISATPDFNSPCAHAYKEKWNQICVPYHYHHFSAASLAMLFAKNDFGLKGLSYPYLETPYADFAADGRKFIRNTKRLLNGQSIDDNLHAYPGTMMSVVFQKMD